MNRAEKIKTNIQMFMLTKGYHHKDMAKMMCMNGGTWRDRMRNPDHFRLNELEAIENILETKLF